MGASFGRLLPAPMNGSNGHVVCSVVACFLGIACWLFFLLFQIGDIGIEGYWLMVQVWCCHGVLVSAASICGVYVAHSMELPNLSHLGALVSCVLASPFTGLPLIMLTIF